MKLPNLISISNSSTESAVNAKLITSVLTHQQAPSSEKDGWHQRFGGDGWYQPTEPVT
jgi:hypothetical protein